MATDLFLLHGIAPHWIDPFAWAGPIAPTLSAHIEIDWSEKCLFPRKAIRISALKATDSDHALETQGNKRGRGQSAGRACELHKQAQSIFHSKQQICFQYCKKENSTFGIRRRRSVVRFAEQCTTSLWHCTTLQGHRTHTRMEEIGSSGEFLTAVKSRFKLSWDRGEARGSHRRSWNKVYA